MLHWAEHQQRLKQHFLADTLASCWSVDVCRLGTQLNQRIKDHNIDFILSYRHSSSLYIHYFHYTGWFWLLESWKITSQLFLSFRFAGINIQPFQLSWKSIVIAFSFTESESVIRNYWLVKSGMLPVDGHGVSVVLECGAGSVVGHNTHTVSQSNWINTLS